MSRPMVRRLIGLAGVLGLALGALWALQGFGIVHVRPILCVADCAEIQGRSTTWALIGLVTAALGAWAIYHAFLRRPRT